MVTFWTYPDLRIEIFIHGISRSAKKVFMLMITSTLKKQAKSRFETECHNIIKTRTALQSAVGFN